MKSIFDNNPNMNDKSTPINYKYCEYCGGILPRNSNSDYCKTCQEILLFHEVKEFIRANDVNEYQVAEFFGLPLRVVKGWIKEGRIEYKETPNGEKTLNNKLVCEACGAPVTFGTLCSKCLKLFNQDMKGYSMQPVTREERMRFLSNIKFDDDKA